jgi:hypothetical protein
MSGGLEEWVPAWDLLDVGGSVLRVVFSEDGESRKD